MKLNLKGVSLTKLTDKLPENVVRGGYKVAAKMGHYKPEILIGVGIAGGIIATVTACKATLKAPEVLRKSEEELAAVKKAKEELEPEVYSEEDYRKDITICYVHKARDLAKLYGPSIAIGTASVISILCAHNIMKSRNVLLAGAYNATNEFLKDYRGRVREAVGEEKEHDIYNGIKTEKVEETVTDEKGKKKKVTKEFKKVDKSINAKYKVFYDETCQAWEEDHDYRMMFLQRVEDELNRRLARRGRVFFWELLEMIGIPVDNFGEYAYTDGWIDDGTGWESGSVKKISLGVFDAKNSQKREFVNGWIDGVLLEPNCDGYILGNS